MLGGRSWKVVDVNWPRRRVSVVPAEGGGRSRWIGAGRLLPFSICRAEERISLEPRPVATCLGARLSDWGRFRDDLEFIDGHSIPMVADGMGDVIVWLFAGGLVAASAARALTQGGILVADWTMYQSPRGLVTSWPCAEFWLIWM